MITISSAQQSVLAEIGNVVLNACVAIIGAEFREHYQFRVPTVATNVQMIDLARQILAKWQNSFSALVLSNNFTVGDIQISVYVIVVVTISVGNISQMIDSLTSP